MQGRPLCVHKAPLERRLKKSVGVLSQRCEIMRCLETICKAPLSNHGRGFLHDWNLMPSGKVGGRSAQLKTDSRCLRVHPRSVPSWPRLGALCFSQSATHVSFPCNGPEWGRGQGEGEQEKANRGKGQRAWRERGDEAVAVAREGCHGKEDRAWGERGDAAMAVAREGNRVSSGERLEEL